MSRQDRLTLIRQAWNNRQTKTLGGLRVAGRENEKEKQNALSRLGTSIPDTDILDEEVRGVAPSIEEPEAEEEAAATSSILLTRAEKRRLVREVAERRFRKDVERNSRFLLLTA